MRREVRFNVRGTLKPPPAGGYEYSINASKAPRLRLKVGVKYVFVIFTPNHPLYITTDAVGGYRDLRGAIPSVALPNDKGVVNGELVFIPKHEHTEMDLYYQCDSHKIMGYKINVVY